jgi:hypothetical protein
MSTHRVKVGLKFTSPGYISKPYWPERDVVINISKEIHPKLGPAKKEAALNAQLEKMGITPAEYARIQTRASRPFYTASDADDGTGEIVIPARVIHSFINHASMEAPKAVPKIESKGLTFIGVKVGDGNGLAALRTGMDQSKSVPFGRFVVLEESNQRSWQEDRAIADFTATGIFEIDDEVIKPENLRKLFEYGGRWYGIGSSRPQGYGRFTVTQWDVI